ncbi:MAG: Flp pilus assembly protein CpaB [Rhizobiaceae bacterium]|nr:Flp pilus assembly protein CpaB [Rhizobiaceae bacterium]
MIGIAGVFGAISIFAADMWLKSAAQARVEPVIVAAAVPMEPQVAFRTIVVAKEPLRFGTELTEAQLTEIPWAQDALPEGASEKVAALLSAGGRVVLSPIEANEPVLLAKLSGPNGRATLSNLLSPGMRAVTIRIDEIAGVGGFVTPGDRVDVVLTRDAGAIQEVEGNADGAAGSTIATEVVVQNAKVLSVGQDLNERSTAPQVAGSVTIEVTPEDAGKVALARNVGTLSLSLRSAGEAGWVAAGLTTLSSFSGSVGAGAEPAAAPKEEDRSIFASEPEKKFKTVVVTRGLKPETYQVPELQN